MVYHSKLLSTSLELESTLKCVSEHGEHSANLMFLIKYTGGYHTFKCNIWATCHSQFGVTPLWFSTLHIYIVYSQAVEEEIRGLFLHFVPTKSWLLKTVAIHKVVHDLRVGNGGVGSSSKTEYLPACDSKRPLWHVYNGVWDIIHSTKWNIPLLLRPLYICHKVTYIVMVWHCYIFTFY